jgi:hypothetical protein
MKQSALLMAGSSPRQLPGLLLLTARLALHRGTNTEEKRLRSCWGKKGARTTGKMRFSERNGVWGGSAFWGQVHSAGRIQFVKRSGSETVLPAKPGVNMDRGTTALKHRACSLRLNRPSQTESDQQRNYGCSRHAEIIALPVRIGMAVWSQRWGQMRTQKVAVPVIR